MFSGFFFLSFSVSPPRFPNTVAIDIPMLLIRLRVCSVVGFLSWNFGFGVFFITPRCSFSPAGHRRRSVFFFRLPQVCQARATHCHFHTIVSLPSLKSSTKKRKVLKCFSSAFPHCYRGERWEDEEEKGKRKKVFGDHRKVRGFFPWKWRDRPDQKTIHRSFVTLSAVSSC